MDDIQTIPRTFSEQNTNLENFFNQSQTNFANISNLVKNIQDSLLVFKNNIDNTLRQVEIDMEQNRSVLAKWMDGANSKLRQEQISQKRLALLEDVKKINDSLLRFSQELSKQIDDFNRASRQFAINYRNLENQLNSSLSNLSCGLQNGASFSPNPALENLQKALGQAMDALNVAQQGLWQRKVFYELNRSIDNMKH